MLKYFSRITIFLPLSVVLLFVSCKTSGPGIFRKKTPHAQYADRLTNAGLQATVLGSSWFRVAEQSITVPLTITIPYKETGYFSADRPAATGLRFTARRGQKLSIAVDKKPVINFALYIDLWKAAEAGSQAKHISAADTATNAIQYEVEENATYILRVQPELLSGGEYTITITSGPSLQYPIKAPGTNHIKSFWGAERDGGVRSHEGIDMFAARGTPVVASAAGRITRVNETPIGGKVVWLRVADKDYTLYYAHLDSQLVSGGESVQTGDTLGLMGNTGNARTTSPHLHFGVYTFNGPVDPLPFVDPTESSPEKITASTKLIGRLARVQAPGSSIYGEPVASSTAGVSIASNTLLQIEAATANWFKIRLPNGQAGFIKSSSLQEIEKPVRTIAVKETVSLFDLPDSLAAKKTSIPGGETVDILANYEDYFFIRTRQNITGWITK